MKEIGSTGFLLSSAAPRLIKTPRDTLGEFSSVPRSSLFQGVPEGEKEVKAMAQEAIAFATPGTEEMTRMAAAGAGAGITGAVEGVVVSLAPKVGALEPVFTWGTLLGVPVLAAVGALFTRGLIADLLMGAACGGLGVIGYTLPAMLTPLIEKRGGVQLTAEQKAALAARERVKLLKESPWNAPQRAQAMAAITAEI